MTNKHTTGPWANDPSGEYYPGHVIRHNGVIVCRMESLIDRDANARLIAAAPDLLAALKALIDATNTTSLAYDEALAAIAKAEGYGV